MKFGVLLSPMQRNPGIFVSTLVLGSSFLILLILLILIVPSALLFHKDTPVLFSTAILIVSKAIPEAEFLDVIGTKVLNVFFLANHSHLYKRILLPLSPLSKSGLKLVCNINIVYGNLKSEKSQDYVCPETSTKLFFHEFGFQLRPRTRPLYCKAVVGQHVT